MNGFLLETETYKAYFYITKKGYFYMKSNRAKKAKRISGEEFINRYEEKHNY